MTYALWVCAALFGITCGLVKPFWHGGLLWALSTMLMFIVVELEMRSDDQSGCTGGDDGD